MARLGRVRFRSGPGAAGASLTHLMGVSASSPTEISYRARADQAALMQIRYSTNSDLSGSTTSTGVSVASADDFTGGETITDLAADTDHYYDILIDGDPSFSAPYPRFKTLPASGAVKLLAGSCQTSPNDDIFEVMAGEGADALLHLGDRVYADTTVVADLRDAYKTMYALGSDFVEHIVKQMLVFYVWSDHDYGGNNEDGDLANKANSLQVFREYTPWQPYANQANGNWFSLEFGELLLVVPDCRYQREGSRPRLPAVSTITADTGSGGSSLVIRAADSPSASNDAYNTWYAEVTTISGTYYRRVSDYVGATRALTLSEAVPDLDNTSTFFIRRSSMLDMDAIANGQTDWLIDSIVGSAKVWKIMGSDVIVNPTFNGSGSDDSWGGWTQSPVDGTEIQYILQEIAAADNVAFASGDRHYLAIDDGTNSGRPELLSSPMNNTNIAPGGNATWSHGTHSSGKGYGTIDINATQVVLTAKDATGVAASGVSPLTVMAA